MNNRPILLFSGGVDSTACLQLMKNQAPILFYFETTKLIGKSKQIQKLAKLVSPYSPFYTFKTLTRGFEAVLLDETNIKRVYGITVEEKEDKSRYFFPAEFNRQINFGYFIKTPSNHTINIIRNITPKERVCPEIFRIPNGQHYLIKKLEYYPEIFNFPLKDMNLFEIDNMINELPRETQKLVNSSTRPYYPNFIPTPLEESRIKYLKENNLLY